MWKILGLAGAMVVAMAAPAMAASACQEPIAPAAIDGSTATGAQIKAELLDVKTFLKQSDDYQSCLLKELDDAKAAAKKDKKDLDPAIEQATMDKIKANQTLKERVGAEFNAAAQAYNAKHPG